MENELLPKFNGNLSILNEENGSFINVPVQVYSSDNTYALIIYKCDGSDASIIGATISGIISLFKLEKNSILKVFINQGDPLFDGKTGQYKTKSIEYSFENDLFELKEIREE